MDEPKRSEKKVLGILALVFGGIGLLMSWIPIVNNVAVIFAGIGIIFGVIALIVNRKNKKVLAIIGLIISVLTVVIVLATQSLYSKALNNVDTAFKGGTAKVDSSSSNDKKTTSVNKQKLTDLAIGTTIDLNGLKVTVNSVTDGPWTYDGKPTKKITVTYKNESTESKSYNEFDWKTENATGDRKDAFGATFLDSNPETLQYGDIAKGGTKTGDLYTEQTDMIKVVYKPPWLSGDEQLIFWKVQ